MYLAKKAAKGKIFDKIRLARVKCDVMNVTSNARNQAVHMVSQQLNLKTFARQFRFSRNTTQEINATLTLQL
jgi:hypothetical protein